MYRSLIETDYKNRPTKKIDVEEVTNLTSLTLSKALELVDRFDTSEIRDFETVENIKRYWYCKRWSIAPYGYDEQPKEWAEFERDYAKCVDEVTNYYRAINK